MGITEIDSATGAMLVRNTWNGEFANRVAFALSREDVETADASLVKMQELVVPHRRQDPQQRVPPGAVAGPYIWVEYYSDGYYWIAGPETYTMTFQNWAYGEPNNAGGDEWLGAPRWSANGRLLYYLSDRDDFICVWARALDPTTLEPTGEPFAIAHAHETEKKMLTAMRSMWSLSVGADRLVFNAARASGNVYTAQLPE